MSHGCPGPDCGRRVPSDMLACRRHWFQVSAPVRAEVWRAWRALLRAAAPGGGPVAAEERHDAAMRAAIAEMKP